ncbi:protein of unknown function [Aminobacter niigataensis]|nr:protein of unknown function [Aminobacter niigataensis]
MTACSIFACRGSRSGYPHKSRTVRYGSAYAVNFMASQWASSPMSEFCRRPRNLDTPVRHQQDG